MMNTNAKSNKTYCLINDCVIGFWLKVRTNLIILNSCKGPSENGNLKLIKTNHYNAQQTIFKENMVAKHFHLII